MSVCRGCGAPIDWIKTTEGRNMPIDPEPVFIIEGGGTDRFVTDEGAVVLGRVARPDEESAALPVGFVPHWKTCPNAADFRRRRQETISAVERDPAANVKGSVTGWKRRL